MSPRPGAAPPAAAPSGASAGGILLDIEGTTTPIDFVYEVLFPFARQRVRDFLAARAGREEVRTCLEALRREHAAEAGRGLVPPPWEEPGTERGVEEVDRTRGAARPAPAVEPAARYALWLMDQDRKSTALKALQGLIWEEGYRSGALRGRVFADVPPALERFRRAGLDVRIFSSGSVLAQKLLFAHSEAGDLTRFLGGYFDTTLGPKAAAQSYLRIAEAMRLSPGRVLFVSDVTAELAAARQAGMQVLLALRPGNRPQPDAHLYEAMRSFETIPP